MTRVLCIGYHGFSNCGADARLTVIINLIRNINPEAKISYATIDKNIESHNADKVVFNLYNLYFRMIIPVIRSDIIIIEEGGPFIDYWGSGFIRFFQMNILYGLLFRKKVIIFSSGIGKISKFNYWFTQKLLKYTNLITARTKMSYKIFKKMDLDVPLYHTADCALALEESKKKLKMFNDDRKIVGICIKDEHCYPIRFRIFGKDEDRYHGNFFSTYANNGREKMKNYIKEISGVINYIIEKGNNVVLLNFEPEIDSKINDQICSHVEQSERIKNMSSLSHSPNEIKRIISQFDTLITSRLHPILLSLDYSIPVIGIYHGGKLLHTFDELGLKEYLIKYNEGHLMRHIEKTFQKINNNKHQIKKSIRQKHKELLERNKIQEELLKGFLN